MTKRKSPQTYVDDSPHYGPTMARFKLGVAREGYRRLGGESFTQNGQAWYLYAASTVMFARAALDALRDADGPRNSLIATEFCFPRPATLAGRPLQRSSD
jgi:hypothetical protein